MFHFGRCMEENERLFECGRSLHSRPSNGVEQDTKGISSGRILCEEFLGRYRAGLTPFDLPPGPNSRVNHSVTLKIVATGFFRFKDLRVVPGKNAGRCGKR